MDTVALDSPGLLARPAGKFKVVLINLYELGRQPFALAEPAAWLKCKGFEVVCLDLSLQTLDAEALAETSLVAVYIGMHTATRIAVEALPRIKQLAPDAHLCVYGLYAPMNEILLKSLGVHAVLGGEFEPGLLSLAQRLRNGQIPATQTEPVVNLDKIGFVVPERSFLPELARYARLEHPDGNRRVVGFAEASRGCKHLCRHCPVVPVYQGKFRIVQSEVVLADIRQQIAQGARHISFGDPDFFNGPTHSLKIVRAMHQEFPDITYDATIKVQHLIENASLLAELKKTGCLFITSAVESIDDRVLACLAKSHSSDDFNRVVALMRESGIAFAPTFVAFTPWLTLEGYIELLRRIADLDLVESVPPVQLSIRLLIPKGSHLLQLPGFSNLIEEFDPGLLGYPWRHRDPRVDQLQIQVQSLAEQSENFPRREAFERIWQLAHGALGIPAPALPKSINQQPVPRLSEPWYCCAEPTHQQLQNF
ncbi:MAG TPA: CUAEP/CCAEP-tail radical SAM protein [Burkholderiales bacterium]|nr:CUAEP/CCAEP-tail radical SAM protein [Burkholderiales bacterium]